MLRILMLVRPGQYNLPHTGFGSLILAAAALLSTAVGAVMVRWGRR
jgi:LPXTG-motif cell wall-anchored protein